MAAIDERAGFRACTNGGAMTKARIEIRCSEEDRAMLEAARRRTGDRSVSALLLRAARLVAAATFAAINVSVLTVKPPR